MTQLSFRIFEAALATVIIASILNKYVIIAAIPLLLIFRREVAVRALSIASPIMPMLIVKDNYVYDPVNVLVHSFYIVEPLFDLSRLNEDRFMGIVNEMLLRFNLCDNCYISFLVNGGQKVVRLSMKDKPPFEEFRNFQDKTLMILKDYFILRQVKGDELLSMVNQDQYGLSKLAITLIIALPLIVYGLAGLMVYVTYLFIIISFFARGISAQSRISFTRIGTKDSLMYSKVTNHDVYSLAKAIHGRIGSYALVISGNQKLLNVAVKEYHKASESFIVKERGKSYPWLMQWRNVIDRLTSGEAPLRMLVLTGDDADIVHFGLRRSRLVSYALWVPEDFMFDALSKDAALLIPLVGGKLNLGEGRFIEIGVDDLGKPVRIDIDSLPAGHMLIVGPSGMGKSWTARTIIRKAIRAGLRIIVVDPHGEYVNLGLPIIDVSERFVDFMKVGEGESVKEKLLRLADSMAYSFNIDDVEQVLADLSSVGELRDFKGTFGKLAKETYDLRLSYIYGIIAENLGKHGYVSLDELTSGAVVSFRSILRNPELTSFAMMQVVDSLYTYFIGRRSLLNTMLIIDEAYYIMGSKLMELYLRGLRKSGLGIVLITQTLSSVSNSILQNIPTSLLMAGPDSYVAELLSSFKLDDNDVDWLKMGLAPHMLGGKAKALLVEGPIRRRVFVDLDPSLAPNLT